MGLALDSFHLKSDITTPPPRHRFANSLATPFNEHCAGLKMNLLRTISGLSLVIIGSAIAAGCTSSLQTLPSGPRSAPNSPQLTAFSQLQLPSLTCEAPAMCNPAVGELIVVTSSGTRYCTVSLVTPDLILTASHCVPGKEALANDQTTIIGGCWVRWPQASNAAGAPLVPCSRLIEATAVEIHPSNRIVSDHAFIQIAVPQVTREPLHFSEPANTAPTTRHHTGVAVTALNDFDELPGRGDGVAPDENENAPPLSENKTTIFGVTLQATGHVLVRKECVRDDAAKLPGVQTLKGVTIILPDCEIEPGFSGGPILANEHPQGRLEGVLSYRKFTTTGDSSGQPALGTKVSGLPRYQ